MVEYTAPVFWFFLLLVGIAFFILRRRDPTRERPFKVPFYPVPPILFCLTCAYLLYSSLMYTGKGALVGIAVLLFGLPLLGFVRKKRSAAPAE
jgi:amino acid transporter